MYANVHRGRRRTPNSWFLLIVAVGLVVGSCSSDNDSAKADGTDKPDKAGEERAAQDDSGPSDDSLKSDKAKGPLERYAGYTSEVYGDPASWLCRPDTEDICDSDMDATEVDADGTLTVRPWTVDPKAPIDCFYVYPTISQDSTDLSDMDASDDEEGLAARNQVARLGSKCRVFAPIYRQRTLAGLAKTISASGERTGRDISSGTPFDDVLDAWKSYMANDNEGRGVVLIGHSQGAALLSQLIEQEIDPNEDVREHLVAAYIAGWAVAVPEGEDVGGSFKNVPLCRDDSETGCVVSWASFRSTALPPPDSYFGKPIIAGEGLVAACNSPASLRGGSAEAESYFKTDGGSIIGGGGQEGSESTAIPWVDPALGKIDTAFVTTPGLVTVECAEHNGAHFLELTIHGDPTDPRVDDIPGDLTPQWGMHLQDVNVVMGNIVDLVAAQSGAYLGDG